MRFSLRTLLLLFPMLAVIAYGLACGIAFIKVAPERPAWTVDLIMLKTSTRNFNQVQAQAGRLTDLTTLNDWFHGRIPVRHPDVKLYKPHLPVCDHRGRPLRCVALSPAGVPLPDVLLANNVGLYSTGPDDESLSHGMDADDVNSWSTTSEQTQALGLALVFERMREQSGYYVPWTLGALLLIVVGVMWIKSPRHDHAMETKN